MFFRRNDSGTEAGCGFLSERQIDAFLERGADPDLEQGFEQHLRDGCAECLHLVAAMEQFREVLERGPVQSERARFAETRHLFRTRLRYAVETDDGEHSAGFLGLGTARGLSPEELEQISAAGEGRNVDPTAGEEDDEDDPTGPAGSR